jgi:hypothetical protein
MYYTGNGFALSIEPTADLLWKSSRKKPGVIRTAWHLDDEVVRDLRKFHLSPAEQAVMLDRGVPLHAVDLHGYGTNSTPQDYIDLEDLFYSKDVLESVITTVSGRVFDMEAVWGEKLVRVIQSARQNA